jgi:excisionase family DNA binding protein
MEEKDYYTPPQAARVLGLSRRRVTQLLNEGRLEGEKLANGRWKISPNSVAAFLKKRSSRQPPARRRSQMDKAVEEVKDRATLLDHRVERLTASLERLFVRLEDLEKRLEEVEKEQKLGKQKSIPGA